MYENKTNRNFKESTGVEAMNILKRIITALVFVAAFVTAPAMAADEVCYAYDELNRLKTVVYCGDKIVYYNYDEAGNRTLHSVESYGACDTNDINETGSSFPGFVILPIAGFQVMPITVVIPAFDGTTDTGQCLLTIDSGVSGGTSNYSDGIFYASATHSTGGTLNMRTVANGLNYDGSSDVILEVTVDQNITGASGFPGANPIDTGAWPAEAVVTLKLTIASGVTIQGGGGDGGDGGYPDGSKVDSNGDGGGDGGHGIVLQNDLFLENNGTINGGSGGGGGGGSNPDISYGGSGGGGGWPNGDGGAAGAGTNPGGAGTAGTSSGGGNGGTVNLSGGDGGDATALTGGDGNGFICGQGCPYKGWGNGGNGGVGGAGVVKNGYALIKSGSGTISSEVN